MFYDERVVHFEDYLALEVLYFKLWNQIDSDDLFRNRYERAFAQSHWFLVEIGRINFFPFELNEEILNDDLVQKSVPLLLTKNEYFGLKFQKRGRPGIRVQPIPEFRRRRFQKRRIGVGYQDKGSLRDKAFDGSPHWKDTFPFLVEPSEWCSQEIELEIPSYLPPEFLRTE
jgi:hypothetical protein